MNINHSIPLKQMDNNTLELVQYSDRSLAIFGNTKEYKEQLKDMGGKFNGFLNYDGCKKPGWIFSTSKYDELVEFMENCSPDGEAEGSTVETPTKRVLKPKTESKVPTPKKVAPKSSVSKKTAGYPEIVVTAKVFKDIKKKTAQHIKAPDAELYGTINPGDKLVFFNGEDMTINRKVVKVYKVPSDHSVEVCGLNPTDVINDDVEDRHSYKVIIGF